MAEHVASDGVRLHVEIAGPDDAPSVVLVHGLAASVGIGWRVPGVLDRLAAAGRRTVAYDARGHGRSGAPHDPASYGDARMAADLAEIVDTFAGPGAVVAGYSMGASTILFALCAGLPVRGAVLGGVPTAVLRWTDADEGQRAAAVAVLEGREAPDAAMQLWIGFLDAIGCDKGALAACLARHRPVVEHWDRVRVPTVVAAGIDDTGAADPGEIAARLADATARRLAGDHFSAVADPAFTDAMIEMSSWGGGMTLIGGLIAESLRVGAVIDGVALTITRISRADLGRVDAGQPLTWTFLDFEAADADAELLAHRLEAALAPVGGWYCDFRNDEETFVVFAGRTFRYPRGDVAGRSLAADYARSVGVPEAQIDWPV